MTSDGSSPALSLLAIPRRIAARITVMPVLVALLAASPGPGWGRPLSAGQVAALAGRCAPSVAPLTLAAVAYAESGLDPLALHDNTTGETLAEHDETAAVRDAGRRLAAGHSLDLGLMQINTRSLAATGLTIASAFEACRSATAGGAILSEDYAGGATHGAEQSALRAALSRYNTGDPERGFANGYVARVTSAARRIVPALDVGGAVTDATPVVHIPPQATNQSPFAMSWDVFPASAPAAAGVSTDWILHPGKAPQGAAAFADADSASQAASVSATSDPTHHEAP